MKNVNLVSLIDRYNTEDKCRDALEAIRWPGGVPASGAATPGPAIERRGQWQCRSATTVQRDRGHHHAPLPPSAAQVVHRHLPDVRVQEGDEREPAQAHPRVQYKTAWYLCRIREAMGNDSFAAPRCSALGWSAARPGARAPATRATSTGWPAPRGGRVSSGFCQAHREPRPRRSTPSAYIGLDDTKAF